ncbi:hypothetical protein KCU98_g15224, partial [Aureobasidium melanogenum]
MCSRSHYCLYTSSLPSRIVFLMLTNLLFAIPVATGTTARVWSEVIFPNRVMPERDGVGVRIYHDSYNLDDYEDQIYEPISQDQILRKEGPFNRHQAVHARHGGGTRVDVDVRDEEMPAQHTPQSTRTTLARLMPSVRRRNVGSDDYELDMV